LRLSHDSNSTVTVFVNRSSDSLTGDRTGRAVSTITAIEVAA